MIVAQYFECSRLSFMIDDVSISCGVCVSFFYAFFVSHLEHSWLCDFAVVAYCALGK